MQYAINDFVITVATVNGSGSQSSNNVLVRSLFRMGIPVGGKNLFPSNIAGLPTWFTIRANGQGFTGRRHFADIVVAMNASTAPEDLQQVHAGGFFIYNSEIKLPSGVRSDVKLIPIPFREIVAPLSDSIKLKKLLQNMIYVGVLAELLHIPSETTELTVKHQFGDKAEVIESNLKAIQAGREYAQTQLKDLHFPYRTQEVKNGNQSKVLIDGNTAGAMGLIFGGCTFVSWYPITPSSSLVESFAELASKYRKDADGKANYAVVQAEDELSAISMVIGAGWAGARALTATSGPGLSLMSEAAGLAYYGEVPAVIWDVQRVGPSTGLPTRTMQADLLSSYYLSHGDTKHVVLLPGNVQECFEFGQVAFDLSERLQTLVIVLSDLDLGMNLHVSEKFQYNDKAFDRGKVLSEEDLQRLNAFARYKDVDGDGIAARTLPGTEHNLAAYFTRGTGHDENAKYSENNEVFAANLRRLEKKFETARSLVPKPFVELNVDARIGLVAFGSTDAAVPEARALLNHEDKATNYLRLKALPLSDEVEKYLSQNDRVYVVEQNRDAQLLSILRNEYPHHAQKLFSVTQFDGLPIEALEIFKQVMTQEKSL